MKTIGPVKVPPISAITRSNLGTDSATAIARIVNAVLIRHLLWLNSRKEMIETKLFIHILIQNLKKLEMVIQVNTGRCMCDTKKN